MQPSLLREEIQSVEKSKHMKWHIKDGISEGGFPWVEIIAEDGTLIAKISYGINQAKELAEVIVEQHNKEQQ